ncbi:MAG: helix-hairpin-helix domain-containing protein [Candidatus Thorarchaeota archaeon]
MREKNLYTNPYKERLKTEIEEIDNQAEHEYFVELYEQGTKYSRNEHNLLIPYLLGIVENFDIDKLPAYSQGEFPDIDVDYLRPVRDYLKNEWAPETFGKSKVCNIGNYTKFGIKSSLIDMAKVHGYDRNEILGLTTKLGLKDDEGEALTWDKALEMHEDLREYLKEHPEVADTARRLLNRNRGMGTHAGGLIISRTPIDNLVPLVKGKDNTHASAWSEGLDSQDLQPVGLVKFDLLVITDLLRIVMINKLIEDRHGVESICALPGQSNWTDTSYLNDPKALALANKGKLKGIFQFDSYGIRRLCKGGGVTGFEDLAAYSALYRPGPLSMKMHETYIKRKRNMDPGWEHEIPKCILPILERTYGVMVFQEQVMQILNVVGEIPLIHCEKVRKAMSKKKVDLFMKYKSQFIINGQKKLGQTEEQLSNLWDQVEAFSGYGFNKSHTVAYTYVSSQLLWQKAHYILEFFAGTLQCEENDKKIKEYKLDAYRFGIELRRLDLDKSDVNFNIVDNDIYIGFSNVKGIGKEIAEKIVENRPYVEKNGSKLVDFLEKFGTDAKVLKPLIALGIFKGADNETLYRFYEVFKKDHKKIEGRTTRYEKTELRNLEEMNLWWVVDNHTNLLTADVVNKWVEEINELEKPYVEEFKKIESDLRIEYESNVEELYSGVAERITNERKEFFEYVKGSIPDEYSFELEEEDVFDLSFEEELTSEVLSLKKKFEQKIGRLLTNHLKPANTEFYNNKIENEWKGKDHKVVWKTFKKYRRSRDGFLSKPQEVEFNLETFNGEDINVDSDLRLQLTNKIEAETKYYGFGWDHPIEKSPSYEEGRTFYQFDEKETASVFPVQVQVVEAPVKRVSKSKNKTVYYTVNVQDADFQKETVIFWEFKSYKFDSPPRHKRQKEVPAEKSKDHRLIIMERPPGEVVVPDSIVEEEKPKKDFEIIELPSLDDLTK